MSNPVERDLVEKELQVNQLLDEACKQANLSDFGGLEFVAPLTKLIDACKDEVNFSEAGLAGFKGDILRILVNRLRMQDDIVKHPEILDEDVSDPIVIVGLVRTGTTKLQRVIASDPGVQSIPLWQILFPSRFPDTIPGEPDPRLAFALSVGGFADGEAAQAMQAGHPMMLDIPDEDILLFENTFDHLYLYLRNYAPSYLEWLKDRSATAPYAYYKKMLQYLQWQNGGKQGKPWVLKCTTHMSELETLFKFFPKATVVHCHRDPCKVIPSYSRLQELAWTLRGNPGDPCAIGKTMMDVWTRQIAMNMATRERHPEYNIVDVAYNDITANVIGVVEKIYLAAGRKLTPEAVAAINEWENNNQQHKFGKHSYSADYFGLSDEQINTAFADYINRFANKIH